MHHFHAFAAQRGELLQQLLPLRAAERIFARMRHDGHAARAAYPFHGLFHRRPLVRHKAGAPGGQEALERVLRGAADAALHEHAREVRARNQVLVAGVFEGAVVGVLYAGFLFHAARYFARARLAGGAYGFQPGAQRFVFRVKAKPHDVHCHVRPGDGDFHAREEGDGIHAGGVLCLGEAFDGVVVGERPEVNASNGGAVGELLRRERAIGKLGMAVQVRIVR